MSEKILTHFDLLVYQKAFAAGMKLFQESKKFPKSEIYSLTDQCRRSSRSVCANIAEAWRKRRYHGAFICKLNDAEAEAAETQTWIQFAIQCEYLDRDVATALHQEYEEIIRMIVAMVRRPDLWLLNL